MHYDRRMAKPAPPHPSEGERLSKRVMQLQGCSRREAEQYIEGGWVTVNGAVVETPQARIGSQTVQVSANATLLDLSPVSLVLHKPAGLSLPKAQALLTPANHLANDPNGQRVLQRHLKNLETVVPLEDGASGLLVFSQDFRVTRKLDEDLTVMEHELMVEVAGEVTPDALGPIQRALQDRNQNLPIAKISVGSSNPERSRLRLAIKGAHPGLAAHLCDLAKLRILAMRRVRLGRVALGDLPPGQWRYLAPSERF